MIESVRCARDREGGKSCAKPKKPRKQATDSEVIALLGNTFVSSLPQFSLALLFLECLGLNAVIFFALFLTNQLGAFQISYDD